MPNIPPDLKDELAIRNYLSRMSNLPAVPGYAGIQSSTANLFKLPVLTDTDLSSYVKGLVKEFDDSLRATIDEVDNALGGVYTKIYEQESILNENYATVEVIADTYATQDEVGAIYGVTVEANGHVSGYKSIATGTSSIFQIYAEKFAVSSSSTEEGYSPFQIDTVAHKINMTSDVAIDGNLLVTGTIVGAKIAASTITASKIAASTITANEIAASTITGNKIAAATITGNKIAAATINSSNMSTNILLVNAYIESSNYSWNGGAPIGFGLYSQGDTVSGQGYNIIGGKLYGGEITGTTINASTINIRNLNLINDAGKALLPIFFATSRYTYDVGAGADTFKLEFDMYTYNSNSNSLKRFIGTTGTIISFSKISDTVMSAPVGYISLVASDYSLTALDLYIKVGTTTLASKTTTWTVNTVYSIGGLRFAIVYDTTVAYKYTFCLLETSTDITLSRTSSSPITIEYSCNVTSMLFPNSLVVQAAVSNL